MGIRNPFIRVKFLNTNLLVMKNIWSCRAAVVLFLLTSAGVFSVSAENGQDNHPVRLDSVSVTGSRVPVALGKSARIVTLMDSTTLASLPVQSVNDLLKYVAGIDVRQRGDSGAQRDGLAQGIKHHVPRVAEDRDGHDVADDRQRQVGEPGAQHLDQRF